MATLTTSAGSTVKTVDSGFANNQAIVGSFLVTAKRSSITSKNVTITIEAAMGYKEYVSGSKSAYGYSIEVSVGATTKTLTINPSGTIWNCTSTSTALPLKSSSTKVYGRKKATVDFTMPWYSSGALTVKGYFKRETTTKETSSGYSIAMPDYSSSSSSGGSTTTTTNGSVTKVTFNPSSVLPSALVTATITGKAGTNNSIAGYQLYQVASRDVANPSDKLIDSVQTTSTSGQIKFYAPSSPGSYQYYGTIINGKDSTITNGTGRYTLTVTAPPPSKPTNCSAGRVEGDGSVHYVFINCRCDSAAYYSIGSSGEKIAMTQSSYDSTYYYASAIFSKNDTIYFYGYNYGTYSAGVQAKPDIFFSVSDVSINITPNILKDNYLEPDLVKVIRNGYASAQTGGGSLSFSWYYAESPTKAGLASASYKSLGVSGQSFNNLDMSQKVSVGNYYRIKVVATNSYQESAEKEDPSIYEIPALPSSVNFQRIIAKSDPSKGYTNIVKDYKTYYGSGLFPIWDKITVSERQLPIVEAEIIYQSRKQGTVNFSETKVAQIQYDEVLEEGEKDVDLYPSTSTVYTNGGGADLEVESLYETRIGVRITDELGQYTDTFYTKDYFYKAESPGFGGDLTISAKIFRPFTCNTDDYITFSSSIGRSNSQDALLYFIDCYVGERKHTINLLEGIPISTKAFAEETENNNEEILYENDNIRIKKLGATTIGYEIKSSYFKDKLLSAPELRTPKNNTNPVYNDDFVDVVYKIYVKDDFDSRSTVYNSETASIKYIEAPSLKNNTELQIGINRYTKDLNPFYGTSIVMLSSLSNNNDRIVNPGESIIFKFKPAKDYNGADYLTTMRGDVTQYNIYVSRNDSPVYSNYENLEYSLLKTFSANLTSDEENPGDLRKAYPNNSEDEYYYLEYPLVSYQQSKFVVFRIEAVDSKSQKSDYLYSNTYIVPCRATLMSFYISNVIFQETLTDYIVRFKTRVNDFGASTFINELYGYNKPDPNMSFPNYERQFEVNGNSFKTKGYIIFEGSLDGDFENTGKIILNNNSPEKASQSFDNYFNTTIDLAAKLGDKHYPDIVEGGYGGDGYEVSDFPSEWKAGIRDGFIKKIFFKVTYKIAYGFKDIDTLNFDDRYLIVSSVSAPYSYYEDAPTVSYRNHQVGINTKDFSVQSEDGQNEVLIIQDNGSYNLVVFKGAEQKIILNLNERTFYTEDNSDPPNRLIQINFDSGIIDGMTIGGGEW